MRRLSEGRAHAIHTSSNVTDIHSYATRPMHGSPQPAPSYAYPSRLCSRGIKEETYKRFNTMEQRC